MNTAEYVSKLIADLTAQGNVLSDVAWQAALACVGWAYVFGARGDYCDPQNRRSRYRDDYPTIKSACKNFNGTSTCRGCKWYPENKRTRFFDCRGFTYWILKQVYGWTLQGAGATSQWNNADNWSSKGEIATMPKNTLCCLFVKKGSSMEHTGFGFNNETCECSVGVQHFTNRNKKWTHWAVPKCVNDAPTPTPTPTPPTPTPTPTVKQFTVTGKNVALREAPSTSAKIITRIPTGTTINEATSTAEWQLIEYNNRTGYMMKEFIKEK